MTLLASAPAPARRGYAGPGFTPAELDDVAAALEHADARGMTTSAVQRRARISDFSGDDVARTRAILQHLEGERRAHRATQDGPTIRTRWFPGRYPDEPVPDDDSDALDDFRQAREAGDF